MQSVTLKSPAKLNLYLKCVNKREDGFHNIVTLFERIDLCDQIKIAKNTSGKIRINCSNKDVPTGPKNLVYKAAQLLKQDLNIREGATFTIKKKIPVAAGMAGGSSNGATALLGLNKIWNLKLTRPQLLKYARQLGSDVAFFIYDTSFALGTERGDKIKPLKIATKLHHVLVTPRLKLYTHKIYGGVKLQLTKKKDSVNILTYYLKKNSIIDLSSLMTNDLEPEAIRQAPKLKRLKERLKSLGIKGVMVSGSGPTVFGLADSNREANNARKALARRYKQAFVTTTL